MPNPSYIDTDTAQVDVDSSELGLRPGDFPLTLDALHRSWVYVSEQWSPAGDLLFVCYRPALGADDIELRSAIRTELRIWND